MKTSTWFGMAFGVSVLGLGGCTSTAETDDVGEAALVAAAPQGSSANDDFFVVTQPDPRECLAPICGGYFVKRVNKATTVCADGTAAAECYVASIDLRPVGLTSQEESDVLGAVAAGKAIFKARTTTLTHAGVVLGLLSATEVWRGATGSPAVGTLYRVADNGIRCITTPCPSTSAYELNGQREIHLSSATLDQTEAKADDAFRTAAEKSMTTTQGILVAGGLRSTRCEGAAECGPEVVASEFYLRVVRRENEACGSRGQALCNVGQFCNFAADDACGATDKPGTCIYRPEACVRSFEPVCGCDGKTYTNECFAQKAGASVSRTTACEGR